MRRLRVPSFAIFLPLLLSPLATQIALAQELAPPVPQVRGVEPPPVADPVVRPVPQNEVAEKSTPTFIPTPTSTPTPKPVDRNDLPPKPSPQPKAIPEKKPEKRVLSPVLRPKKATPTPTGKPSPNPTPIPPAVTPTPTGVPESTLPTQVVTPPVTPAPETRLLDEYPTLLQTGLESYHKGNFYGAKVIWLMALKEDPKNWKARAYLERLLAEHPNLKDGVQVP